MREQLYLEKLPFELNRLREIVRLAFPGSEITQVIPLSIGRRSINLGITIGNPELSLNLRVFKGEDPEARAKKEEYFYRLISQHTGVPVPTVYLKDDSRRLINDVLILESKLPGVNLGQVCPSLSREEQEDLAFHLGICLAQIHSIKFEKYGDKLEGNQMGQFSNWREYFLQFIRENLAQCSKQKVISPETSSFLGSYVEKRSWILDVDLPPCLVHQDFLLENINVLQSQEGEWSISGLYDFEHGISGHHEWDFAKPRWAIFDRYSVMRQPMLEGYLEVGFLSDEFEERLSLYQVAESIDFWVFGCKVGLSSEVNRSIKETVQNIKGQL